MRHGADWTVGMILNVIMVMHAAEQHSGKHQTRKYYSDVTLSIFVQQIKWFVYGQVYNTHEVHYEFIYLSK